MKRTFQFAAVLMLALVFSFAAQAQDKGARPSPMRTAKATVPSGEVTIQYSSPQVKGRKIWGDLVPYGKVWRTGANEATTITIPGDMKVEGGMLKAGKYALFTIPGETEWTIIFNSAWDQWGAYNYNQDKDAIRITAKPEKSDKLVEDFTISATDQGEVIISWEYVSVTFELM